MTTLLEFYNDGLKDCSWISAAYTEFEKMAESSTVRSSKTTLVITVENNSFMYLDTVYVLKAYRNNGLGSMVLKSLAGKRTILFCNPKISSFYEKFGFTSWVPYRIMVKA